MDALAGCLVGQPLHILAVAMVWFVLWAALARRPVTRPRARGVRIAALGWLAYAGWEALVLLRSPEADIRVDLLAIWPLLFVLMLWAAFRAFVPGPSRSVSRIPRRS